MLRLSVLPRHRSASLLPVLRSSPRVLGWDVPEGWASAMDKRASQSMLLQTSTAASGQLLAVSPGETSKHMHAMGERSERGLVLCNRAPSCGRD